MICDACEERPAIARGLCQRCYLRQRRTGSVERKNVQNQGRLCSADGCDKPAMAKGLCMHHYSQQQHPLRDTWKLLRSRHAGQFPLSWDRFEAFLADAGERPGPSYRLQRIDVGQPWHIGNMRWSPPVNPNQQGKKTKEERAQYQREWHLQRKFNLTGEEYAELLNRQGGGCAICGKKETHTYRSGKLKDLSVDHDHKTGAIRGLLCVCCNRAVGYLNDDPQLLRKAADYLEGT